MSKKELPAHFRALREALERDLMRQLDEQEAKREKDHKGLNWVKKELKKYYGSD